MGKDRKKLMLDKSNRKFLGVCAGLASYLGVEAWAVRLLFVVSVLLGAWFLIPIYFIAYFLLDNRPGEFKEKMQDNRTFKHLKNVDYKKKLYLNKKEAKVCGVCAGIADYLEIDATIVRVVVIVLFFVGGPIPWIAYFGALFVMEERPPEEEARLQSAYAGEHEMPDADKFMSKRREFKNCVRKFSTLQRRLTRIEAYVTSTEFKLHREFKEIS